MIFNGVVLPSIIIIIISSVSSLKQTPVYDFVLIHYLALSYFLVRVDAWTDVHKKQT